jgi:hypothetical protein
MPRNRMIKREFFRDAKVGALPLGARLLFISSWIQADDIGNCVGEPCLMKAEAFPFDETVLTAEVEEWIGKLESLGMVLKYEVAGQRYLNIRNFLRHQVIDRPSKFRYPVPNTQRRLDESSLLPQRASSEDSVLKVKVKVNEKGKEKENSNCNGVTVMTVRDRQVSLSEKPCARKAENAWDYTGLNRERMGTAASKEFVACLEKAFAAYVRESHYSENGEEHCDCFPSDVLEAIMQACQDDDIKWPKACKAQKQRLIKLEEAWDDAPQLL